MTTTMFMECVGASGVMIGLVVTVQQLALGRTAHPRAVDELIGRLQDPESDLAPQIARALREARNPEGVDPLLGQLDSADRETQVESVRALGELGDTRAAPPLLDLLRKTEDPKITSASSRALAQLGEIAAVYEILPRMKQTANPVLKRSLAVAVGDLLGQEQDFHALLISEEDAPGPEVSKRLGHMRRVLRKSDVAKSFPNASGLATTTLDVEDASSATPAIPRPTPEGQSSSIPPQAAHG